MRVRIRVHMRARIRVHMRARIRVHMRARTHTRTWRTVFRRVWLVAPERRVQRLRFQLERVNLMAPECRDVLLRQAKHEFLPQSLLFHLTPTKDAFPPPNTAAHPTVTQNYFAANICTFSVLRTCVCTYVRSWISTYVQTQICRHVHQSL